MQLFGFGGLEVSKKNGYHYNYYDNDLRRRKNKSNRNGRNLVHSWPQLSKIQVINCPLITSTAAVKKHKYNFDGSENKTVHKKSLFQSMESNLKTNDCLINWRTWRVEEKTNLNCKKL